MGRAGGGGGRRGGATTRRGPLTHSFKQRATASLLGNRAAQTNRAGGGGRLAGELRAGREGNGAGKGGARWGGARRRSRGLALRPHPQKPCWGRHPSPQGPGLLGGGDPSRDSVMQNGCDLQCVSVNAMVPATVRVCARPCLWVRGRVGVWAYVGVLGRVPRDM